jgi:high-affinity iron transporter
MWSINNVLDDGSGVGLWLKALFGYNGNPSLLEVVAYPLYLSLALWYFLAPRQPRLARTPEPPRRAIREVERAAAD